MLYDADAAIQLTKYGNLRKAFASSRSRNRAIPTGPNPDSRLSTRPSTIATCSSPSGLYAVKPNFQALSETRALGKCWPSGDAVQNVKAGDRVVIPRGVFSWAQKVLAPAQEAIVLPPEIDPQQAAMLSIYPPAAALLLGEFVSLSMVIGSFRTPQIPR